eukprot:gene31499-40907_t
MQFSTPHQIQTSEGRGRSFILSRQLISSDVAIYEEAYALIPLQRFSCACCYRTIVSDMDAGSVTIYETAKDDPNKYCSQECLVQDFPIHTHEIEALKIILSFYSKNEGSPLSHFADLDRMRLLLRISATRKYEIETSGKLNKSSAADCTTNATSSSHFNDILALQGLPLSGPEIAEAKKLTAKLSKIGSLCKLPLLSNAQEVLHILSVFRCNAHHVVSDNGAVVALGLFPLVSMLNHSCQPNCIKYFDFCGDFGLASATEGKKRPPRLVIRPMRTIAEGEELVYSYVPLYQSTAVRRGQLEHSYGFTCSCSRCEKWGSTAMTQEGLDETYLDAEYRRETLSIAQRPRFEAAKGLLESLLSEYAGVMPLRGGDAVDLRWQLLDRYVLFLGDDLNSLSGVFFPQHKLLLQFYVCMLNLSVSVYRISEGEGEGEESRTKTRSIKTAIALGLLAVGCLYAFLHSDHIDKETAVIEAAVAVACELCLTNDLPLPSPPPATQAASLEHEQSYPPANEESTTFTDSLLSHIIGSNCSSTREGVSFFLLNKTSVISLWNVALSKCSIPAGHDERVAYNTIRLHFTTAAQEHMRICRGKIDDS